MEYYGNKLCVSYQDLVDGGIVSACNYRNLVNRRMAQWCYWSAG